uniref:Tetratricopeptide repeat protein 30 n=1 Tax=Globodera pallida TaxID=36090 RepID=A0A183CM83_GLOPA
MNDASPSPSCHFFLASISNSKKNLERFWMPIRRKHATSPPSILLPCLLSSSKDEEIKGGAVDHQELGVGMGSEVPFRSVGNTLMLHESAVVEACNLKFAIEYRMKNLDASAEALSDLPARMEEELDPVTLHNQALVSVESNLADSFSKLQYLLGNNPCPPETFANLLLLYCKFEYFDLAADVLAENAHLTYKLLTQYQFDYLDALITQQSSDSEAYAKFDALTVSRLNALRKRHQKLRETREEDNNNNNARALQRAVDAVETCLDEFLPTLMAQAKLLWDKAQWAQIERLFRRSAEFCHGNETWKLNLAHTLYMQEKYKEASDCYAPLVRASFDKLLDVSAAVLANLCACYVMTSSNEEAEEVMRRVEREENAQPTSRNIKFISPPLSHNLVIGTLYCSKGNYEFGISRIVRALEPCEKKLGVDTWFYSKRCMASMLENIARCVIELRDEMLLDCLHFLESCEMNGREIVTDAQMLGARAGELPRTVAHEARLLRALLLQIMD